MAKPDDRSDNAEKIKTAIINTQENINETNDYLAEHAEEISGQEVHNLQHKNAKRERAIEGMREEYEDEK